ncbi:MAG: TonB-dependent receptor [Candidatus Omnitrophica bacterium]|nr:TonB-dependent receptor [Candidatus Omnitrophota bacterium]
MKKCIAILITLFISLKVSAFEGDGPTEGIELPAIMITPTKYEVPTRGIPSSFTIVYEDELVSQGKVQVKDILMGVPGLHVVQTGSFGSPTSIFTRGTESSHTLVMIDGVKVFDPTSTNGAFNFANLTLDNIERVEVLRGPHSTLYGSDAMGGVVNIITKKGEGRPKVWSSFEGGSFSTFKESAGSYGEFKGFHYSAAFSRLDTEGISKADSKYDNDEEDGYVNTSFSTRIDYEPFENVSCGGTFRYTDAEIEIDDGGGYNGDDPNRRDRERVGTVSSYLDFDMNDWWSFGLKWMRMHNERFDKDFLDELDANDYIYSKYEGLNTACEIHNVFRTEEYGTLSCGIDYDEQESDTYYFNEAWGIMADTPKRKNHNVGYYVQNRLTLGESFYSIIGVRLDDHSEFGFHDTYKIHAKYVFDSGTSVKGGWSTGFKAPSLYQLYDPTYGSTDLRPEENETYELGAGQSLFEDKLEVESTYFRSELDDLIDWVSDGGWGGQYQNVNRAIIWGIENVASLNITDKVYFDYSYTYLETENEATKQSLDRRPRHKHTFNIRCKPTDKLNVNLTYLYVGNRKDNSYTGNQTILDDYHKVDVSARYLVNEYLELFGRIENLLDKHYQEVDGYGVPGISFYGGGKVTF